MMLTAAFSGLLDILQCGKGRHGSSHHLEVLSYGYLLRPTVSQHQLLIDPNHVWNAAHGELPWRAARKRSGRGCGILAVK